MSDWQEISGPWWGLLHWWLMRSSVPWRQSQAGCVTWEHSVLQPRSLSCLSRNLELPHRAVFLKLCLFPQWLPPVQLGAQAGQTPQVSAYKMQFPIGFFHYPLGTKWECVPFPPALTIPWVWALAHLLWGMKIIKFKVCKLFSACLQGSWVPHILVCWPPFVKDRCHLDAFIGGNYQDPGHKETVFF